MPASVPSLSSSVTEAGSSVSEPGSASIVRSGTAAARGDFVRLGAEEEFHVVDLATRELVPAAGSLLVDLPDEGFSHELQRSIVETNTTVSDSLEGQREELVRTRRALAGVASSKGLAVVAAGTVPLVDSDQLSITPTARYERMLDDYQLLVREQLICGAQVHVQVSDREVAVLLAQRVTPYLPVLLALSASSPYWMGEDTGYASSRSLLWQRWPTAGLSGEIASAAEHAELVADLVASETISDPGMIYFDVRPSAHLPTLELRVTDSSPEIDTVVLIAALFRASAAQRAVASLALRTRGQPARPAAFAEAGARGDGGDPARRAPAPGA
jgi:carboxylate-amine ligase